VSEHLSFRPRIYRYHGRSSAALRQRTVAGERQNNDHLVECPRKMHRGTFDKNVRAMVIVAEKRIPILCTVGSVAGKLSFIINGDICTFCTNYREIRKIKTVRRLG
jgi:hypothetical protein